LKNAIQKISAVALVIILLLTFCGFTNAYNPKAYYMNNILKTIMEITSKEFNGRAAGTPDGKKTEDYFAAKFKEIGLKPVGDYGTYFQRFTGIRGEAEGPYLLEVVDGSSVIKTYKYGTDYKFLTRYSCNGDVMAIGKVVEETSENMPKASGEIAFLSAFDIPNGQTPKTLIDLYNAGYRGVIAQGKETINRIKGQRGIFDDSNASKLPGISVSKPVFAELLDYSNNGCKIHLKANFVVSPYCANNVIGVLEAAKPTQDCLIVSAHMDHVGPDPDGAYFPGALDNASGSSSIVEIARALMNQNVKPSINIVFIAFNGEETASFDGSRKYVSAPLYPLKNSKNINLDGIGSKSKLQGSSIWIGVSSFSDGDKKSTKFINEIKKVIKSLKFDYKEGIDDSSDHTSFAQSGVPAVTLMDMDADVYHVPEDTTSNIGVENLTRDVDITMNLIGKFAYAAR
jgi:aminopeptidase YwaD